MNLFNPTMKRLMTRVALMKLLDLVKVTCGPLVLCYVCVCLGVVVFGRALRTVTL